MPRIYEYFGLVFFFYSDEHLPIHVHVSKAEREMKFELLHEAGKLVQIDIRKIKGKEILTPKEIDSSVELIKQNHEAIVLKWTEFFVKGQKPKNDKITKKL